MKEKALLLFVLLGLTLPTIAHLQNVITGITTVPLTEPWRVIEKMVDILVTGILIVALFLIVAGGFIVLTSGGEPEKVTQGRNYIIYAFAGAAIAFLAKGIFKVITDYLFK